MAGFIEIKDKDPQGGLAVELIDILDLLAPEGCQLTWAILDLEATGDPEKGKNMLDLEQEIERSSTGLLISWDALISLARSLFQVINAVIVGCKDVASIPKLQPGEPLYVSTELVLEAIDSSLWRVYARDDKVLRRLQEAFHEVYILTAPQEQN
jgi:hypothetical protein